MLAVIPVFFCFLLSVYAINMKDRNRDTVYFENLLCLVVIFAIKEIVLWGKTTIIFTAILFFSIQSLLLIKYYIKIKISYIEARKAAEIERRLKEAKSSTLMAQIKPHFLFNVLTGIQGLYTVNAFSADTAMRKLSEYLSAGAISERNVLIPFTEEIKNIENYFSLEELRLGGRIRLFIELQADDFKVPSFSLQPLVENSLKHAKLSLVSNGHIKISSGCDDGKIIIEIEDNGAGFDTASIRSGAVGIANSRERLLLYLNASFSIRSSPGNGTKIIISFSESGAET